MVKRFHKWCWLFLSILFLSFSKTDRFAHPYHVSATEIEYNKESAKLEISIKIFIDDFENVLKQNYQQKIDLHKAAYKNNMDQLIADYIAKHIFIINKNKKYTPQLLGWETDLESIVIYATAPIAQFDKSNIEVINTILFDYFDDQMNIVHFFVDGKRKSEKFYNKNPKIKFNF